MIDMDKLLDNLQASILVMLIIAVLSISVAAVGLYWIKDEPCDCRNSFLEEE